MRNTQNYYDWFSIVLHWVVALSIFSLFGLGFWMVELTYYDAWYKAAPELHKSIGLTLFMLMLIRIVWKGKQNGPLPLKEHSDTEVKVGKLVHRTLYILIFAAMLSGYFISTSDGRGIEVFGLFEVPGFGSFIENQEDIAGLIHKFLTYTLIALVVLHASAALKHHFIDKDMTLKRMLGVPITHK